MRLLTPVRHVVAAVVGLAVGVASVAVHRTLMAGLPVGLALSLGTTLLVAWSLRLSRPRLAASYALGWLVAVGLVTVGRPEGDYAIVADVYGYLLMAAALLLAVVGVTSLASPNSSSGRGRTYDGAL